jgi:hypothetical protein
MKMTMSEDEILGRIKMGVNVDIKRSDGKANSGSLFLKIVYSIEFVWILADILDSWSFRNRI